MAINSNRMVIIEIDGMPYHLIRDLSQSGGLPNTRAVIEKCVFRQMESSIPELSSATWSSIVTGTNPGDYGIFGFTDIPIGTYRLSLPSFNDLKMPPFWKQRTNGRSKYSSLSEKVSRKIIRD
ncbi:alkaline phosphatase family protein [Chloroflexota bacterium]